MTSRFTIVAVRAWTVARSEPETPHWLADDPMATPLGHYPDLRDRRSLGALFGGTLLIEIEASNGTVGFALGAGGAAAGLVVLERFASLLVGEDARDMARIWDRMHRLAGFTIGTRGLAMLAISVIDLALWDLLGRLRDEPVFRLIGGDTHRGLDVYLTGPRAVCARELGFPMGKVTLPHGSGEGTQGLRKAVEFLAAEREAVGPDFPLAVDCWCGLDVNFAIDLAHATRSLNLAFLEEPFALEERAGYARLKAAAPWLKLATGEHEYGRWAFRDLIATGAIDILQPDLRWCGGLSEALRIATLASAHGIAVMPHTGGAYSFHFAAAVPEITMVESSTRAPDGMAIVAYHGAYFAGETLPHQGRVALPDRPGFGLDLRARPADFARPVRLAD